MGMNRMLSPGISLLGTARAALWVLPLALAACLAWTAAGQSDPAAVAERARRAMAESRFDEAADLYSELARNYPDEPSLHANLGMALHLSGQDRRALPPLRKAVASMPSSFQVQFFLGASLTRLGEFEASLEPLRRAVDLDSGHPFAKALLADALEAADEPFEAAGVWKALRTLQPSSPYPHAGLVRCYERLAADALDELIRRDPESPLVLRLLARSRMAAAQYPSALYLFRQALEREPGVRIVHEAVAEIYRRSDRSDWSAAEMERADALPRADCAASASPGCVFERGEYDRLARFSPEAPAEEVFWGARAFAMLARETFASLTSQQESVDQLRLLADILAAQQQFSKAADAYRRALALRPDDGHLKRQVAELLYRARRIDEARPMLERLLASDPEDGRWPAMLGSLLAEEQDFGAAIPLLEAAMALPQPGPGVRLGLGRSYLAVGKPEEAAGHLRASLETDQDGSVHYQLAQAYQQMGRRDEARAALAAYRELNERARQRNEASASLAITPPD